MTTKRALFDYVLPKIILILCSGQKPSEWFKGHKRNGFQN